MNKYKVVIKRKDGCPMNADEIKGFLKHNKVVFMLPKGLQGIDQITDVRVFYYAISIEDVAISVYAKAKRNLDPEKYMVTLELPGKEAK